MNFQMPVRKWYMVFLLFAMAVQSEDHCTFNYHAFVIFAITGCFILKLSFYKAPITKLYIIFVHL